MCPMSGQADDERSRPDGRATRWDRHKNERKLLILGAAIDAIKEIGRDVGVAQIAERAGLPRSVIYRVFKDRDDLDEQIRTQIVQDLMADMQPVLELQGNVEEAIRKVVTTYVTWVIEYPELHQFLGRAAAPRSMDSGSAVVADSRYEVAKYVSGLIETIVRAAGKEPGVSDTMSFGLVGFVDASVNRWVAHKPQEVTSDELIDFLCESIWLVIRAAAVKIGMAPEPKTALKDVT